MSLSVVCNNCKEGWHDNCLVGRHVEGVLGGWDCSCDCRRGPRFTVVFEMARFNQGSPIVFACEDCGCLVVNKRSHTRLHSIESSWAWALAVLKTAHVAAHVHDKYDVVERINSKTFDNWSADALAEVIGQTRQCSWCERSFTGLPVQGECPQSEDGLHQVVQPEGVKPEGEK